MRRAHVALVAGCAALVLSTCAADGDQTAPTTTGASGGVLTSVADPATEPDTRGPVSDADGAPPVWEGRVDIRTTGNRVSAGRGDLDRAPLEIRLASPAVWLVPMSPARGSSWAAVLDDGTLVTLDLELGTVHVLDPSWGAAEPIVTDDGRIVAATARPQGFDDQLSDARWVTDGRLSAALTDPTERYGHGVLGDRIEAAGFSLRDELTGERVDVALVGDVVEGTSAILADVVGDATSEILVTQSNTATGARLVVYDRFGRLVAESQPIGLGNRWRNQLAVAPVGPDREVEIIDIRTPHIGGTVEWFRIDDGRLVRVAALGGFTSHVIGSRNLDFAIVADPDADGRLEVLAPADDRRSLGVITRFDGGAQVEFRVDLSDRLTSNVGAVDHPDGTATYAAGTADGIVRVWVPR